LKTSSTNMPLITISALANVQPALAASTLPQPLAPPSPPSPGRGPTTKSL
jgi:hypothetical protein